MTKYYIIGTGTDVGKTYVTGLLLKHALEASYNAAYYKPAMSGNRLDDAGQIIPGDACEVQRISGSSQPVETMCSFIYQAALSPHLAARQAGRPIDPAVIAADLAELTGQYDMILLEGCGGIICPLRDDDSLIMQQDLMETYCDSTILVADAGLGSINATVLSVHYLTSHSIPLSGIILNNFQPDNPMHQDNYRMIERLSGQPVIGTVSPGADRIDWMKSYNLFESRY